MYNIKYFFIYYYSQGPVVGPYKPTMLGPIKNGPCMSEIYFSLMCKVLIGTRPHMSEFGGSKQSASLLSL